MASNKRRRAVTGDEEEEAELVEEQSARSNQRRSLNKRPRLALAAENGGSVVSDEEEEVEGADEMEQVENEQLQQWDETEFDDENEEALVNKLRNSPRVLEQLRTQEENQPSECGIIEEVFCRNFMCHSKLRIKLGPLINFIIGHNGSGKSAVMTALTICLGVKATATNRASSLKSFIKEGEENAMLSVRIKNQGDLAYQPELYGHSIIVERHFNRAGTSSFKIKNADERIITTKRADLEDLLDYMALQLDNPLNVLSQDSARQFLSSSTPRDKYKFFMKGTQLEQLDRDYRVMEEYVDQIEVKIEGRQADIAHLQKRKSEAEARKKLHDQSQNLREKIQHLQFMHAWAQVEEIEQGLVAAQDKLQAANNKVEEREREFEAKSQLYDERNHDYEATLLAKEDRVRDLGPIQERRTAAKEEFDNHKNLLLEGNAERRKIQTDLTAYKDDIVKFEGQIQEEEARIEAAQGPQQAAMLADLAQAESLVEEKKQEEVALDKTVLTRNLNDAQKTVSAAQEALREPQQSLEQAKNRLQGLRSKGNQQMAGYHESLQHLLRAINNESRFKQKPVGPMGLHVRLLQPEWSSIIESWFAQALEAFVVTSKHDQNILTELMRRNKYRGDVFIGNGGRIDVSSQEPLDDVATILRVLEIDNDLVRNQLIINQRIEQVVLIRERSKAMAFMYERSPVPANVQFTICHGDRGWGIRLGRTKTGYQSSGPVRAFTKIARMKTDIEAQIRIQQETVNQAERSVDAAQARVREADMGVKRANEAIIRFGRTVRNVRAQRQEAEARVDELKAQIEQSTVDEGRLDELRGQLRDTRANVRAAERSFEDALIEKDRLNNVQREGKVKLDKATAELAEATAKVTKVDNSLKKAQEKRQSALSEKNLVDGFIKGAKDDRDAAQTAVEKRQEDVDSFQQQASEVCNRIAVDEGMTCDLIDARIDKLTADMKKTDSRAGGTREEVTEAWAQAVREYKHGTKDLRELTNISDQLKQALQKRKYRWNQFRKHITARAKFMFTYLLSERAFRGRILVDHAQMLMDISVEPDIAKSSDRGRQTKTLSGGEKSFSTICLLLSIWEAMGSPIRCLDEFDVFMDNVNRDISMKMMIGAARRSVGKQFILITPQAMGNVQLGSDVKIHKMSDPERGQTTLPFGQ